MIQGNIIVGLLVIAVLWLMIGVMRSNRRAWVERQEKKRERAAAEAKLDDELRTAVKNSFTISAITASATARQRAQDEAARQIAAARVDFAKAQSQAKDANHQPEAQNASAWYDVLHDVWRDRSGKVVPDPRAGKRMHRMFAEEEPEFKRQRNLDAMTRATDDAAVHGVGVVHWLSGDATHIPTYEYRSHGGSFDGGGASGDYTPAPSSCDSSSSSSASDNSSSCSSSDSGSSGSSD